MNWAQPFSKWTLVFHNEGIYYCTGQPAVLARSLGVVLAMRRDKTPRRSPQSLRCTPSPSPSMCKQNRAVPAPGAGGGCRDPGPHLPCGSVRALCCRTRDRARARARRGSPRVLRRRSLHGALFSVATAHSQGTAAQGSCMCEITTGGDGMRMTGRECGHLVRMCRG